MHSHSLDPWTHDHVFLGQQHARNERRTWFVVAITAVMMVGEIAAGSFFGSMALLADGWHMATHAAALGIAAAAYLFARQHARNSRFAFGTGKFGDLAAFSSAIILAMIAVQVAYESAVRLVHPVPIAYGEAILVAALGLGVNLVSAWLLRDTPRPSWPRSFPWASSPRQQSSRGLCPCACRRRNVDPGHPGAGRGDGRAMGLGRSGGRNHRQPGDRQLGLRPDQGFRRGAARCQRRQEPSKPSSATGWRPRGTA